MTTVPELRVPNDPPNILIVGAGGIGCEIVKSLALAGFTKMTVIDFDTVSLSNLSRQFFYSEEDIGMEKAAALAHNAKRLYPDLEITGLFMDVLGPDFDYSFVIEFDFVFVAVDNVAARSRVNKLCVFTRTLMIDCGSSGRYAQSVPVFAFRTACYECSPPVAPSGPKITCTIRSTPEHFEHCAAWAFHLFDSVYANSESTDVIKVEEGSSIFQVAFIDKVNELRSNEGMWRGKVPPNPVDLTNDANPEPANRPMDVWSDEESVGVFKYISQALRPPQTFDKDNAEHLAFVTAAANLRARSFHIEKRSSMFYAKGLVAVVEPALATTNSVISSIAVLQMQRMFTGDAGVKAVWMTHNPRGPKLSPTSLEMPKMTCPICGHDFWEISCDFANTKCSEIGKAVGASAPSVSKGASIIYDADDESHDPLLSSAGVVNGDILVVTDLDGDDETVNVMVLSSDTPSAEIIRKVVKPKADRNNSSDYDDSDVEIIC